MLWVEAAFDGLMVPGLCQLSMISKRLLFLSAFLTLTSFGCVASVNILPVVPKTH